MSECYNFCKNSFYYQNSNFLIFLCDNYQNYPYYPLIIDYNILLNLTLSILRFQFLKIFYALLGKGSILEELSVLLAPVIDKTEFSRQMDNSRVVRKEVRKSHFLSFLFYFS